MPGQLAISPEVMEALGQARADAIRKEGASGLCPICRAEVSTLQGDDASVLVESYLNEGVIVFAHDTCAESQIIYMGRASSETPSDDVSSICILVPGARENRALIFVAPDSPGVTFLASGERLSPWVAGLMAAGWEVMTAVGKPAVFLGDWSAKIDPATYSMAILDSNGSPMLEQQMRNDNELWSTLALHQGEITVVSGDVDIDRIILSGNALVELQRLAKLGHLIGVRIPAKQWQAQSDPFTTASRSVADMLGAAIRKRARPVTPGKTKAFGVKLHTIPRISPFVVRDSALLVIDLDDFDADRGKRTIEALVAAGFPSGVADSTDHFLPNASRGWSCLVWRSQIQILGRGTDGKPEEHLFVPFPATGDKWLQAVRAHKALGIVFGNSVDDEKLTNLVDEIRSGTMIGAALLALPAI
ncbi:hypothetical protein [Arthrobacter sp. SAFR-044]|uniref:hypothetical protein n=1 Tax=Arthrobacter sp. SAFR-044 TaxID=3387278 RepID=UPI003F7BFD7C